MCRNEKKRKKEKEYVYILYIKKRYQIDWISNVEFIYKLEDFDCRQHSRIETVSFWRQIYYEMKTRPMSNMPLFKRISGLLEWYQSVLLALCFLQMRKITYTIRDYHGNWLMRWWPTLQIFTFIFMNNEVKRSNEKVK